MSIRTRDLLGYYDASYPPSLWGGGGEADKAKVKPGDFYPAEATITASDQANADKLAALGYVVDPATVPWQKDASFKIEQPAFPDDPVYAYSFHWATASTDALLPSNVWKPSPVPDVVWQKANAMAGNNYVPDPNVTASDSANAANLTAYGYTPQDPFGWGYPGATMTIGGFGFYFDQPGGAWRAGAHA